MYNKLQQLSDTNSSTSSSFSIIPRSNQSNSSLVHQSTTEQCATFSSLSLPDNWSQTVERCSFEKGKVSIWDELHHTIDGTDLFFYFIVDGFGQYGAEIVSYVASDLKRELLDVEKFKEIVKIQKATNNTDQIRNKMEELLTAIFSRQNAEIYRKYSVDSPDEDCSASGSTIILTLILKGTIYIVNYGDAIGIFSSVIGGELAVFEITETTLPNDSESSSIHIDLPFQDTTAKTTRPLKYIGKKASNKDKSFSTYLKIDSTTKFLLLISSRTYEFFRIAFPETDPIATVSTIVAQTVDDDWFCSAEIVLKTLLNNTLSRRQYLQENCTKFENMELCMAYLNLTNFASESTVEGLTDEDIMLQNQDLTDPINESNQFFLRETETVESEVDWSEFQTHHLRETVLAKIESLKQFYKDRRYLNPIDEDLE